MKSLNTFSISISHHHFYLDLSRSKVDRLSGLISRHKWRAHWARRFLNLSRLDDIDILESFLSLRNLNSIQLLAEECDKSKDEERLLV